MKMLGPELLEKVEVGESRRVKGAPATLPFEARSCGSALEAAKTERARWWHKLATASPDGLACFRCP
jgi:hypothetical protein